MKRIDNYSTNLNEINLNQHYTNKAYLYKRVNQLDSAANYFIKSLNYFEKDTTRNYIERANIYQGLANIYRLAGNSNKYLSYLFFFLKESIKSKEVYNIGAALNGIGAFYDRQKKPHLALKYFKKALKYKLPKRDLSSIYQNIGSIYLTFFQNNDSAYYYNKKAINSKTPKRTLAYIYYDLSIISKRKKKYLQENKKLKIALTNILLDPFQELEVKLYRGLSNNNKKLKNHKQALFYLEKYDSLNKIIKNQKQIEIVEGIEIKYQTEKKENENLQLKQDNLISEQKRKQNKNLFYGALTFFTLSGAIGFLTLKNSRKKRLLSEQQKEIEKQKNLTLLKEQEILTINSMVEGQEKERIRIAEDLHDNIGSVLATLKLHFENLKLNREKKHFNQDELYKKTENLIDETYLKVRSIAHAKNAGVIANKGLLVAIKLMAEKISDANKITIHVLDFGLDKRLENKLEITLFRIIQELITNIIKHANASEATVNIALYDQNLNIIIEDNGNGFKYDKTILKEGIGLSSITTRIQHLKGTFDVDSTLEKGTSIIINIPVV